MKSHTSSKIEAFLFSEEVGRVIDIHASCGAVEAGVAKLGQRRWDEVPVSMSSQVRILPSALQHQNHPLVMVCLHDH